ncbi:hypothetical protein K2Z83_21565 [Oscillochloris sp. ZM17-4]|uniref:hypothetical protein n=1 Tax=Oscillochloris sp. ZM17-4 TaxID=2866714 RepID=UPI001C733695|nr:hypothetical protein [Oscillochloris sp. ZM17-4]MBX0330260.1 hypothetical protein [Oscillochloris sp. ZM17-4]
MISLEMARQLREAGLEWRPAERDVFALPGHDMDGQVFVVSPLPALVQRYNGMPVVAFQTSAEWALDYVMLAEAMWMPSEGQLREALAGLLAPDAPLGLSRTALGYRCAIALGGQPRSFDGPDAETAYAQALIAALVYAA